MKKTLSICFVYVGTVIGAGFATGQEILLYFGDSSIFSVLIAGFLLGLFCYVFLLIGNNNENIYSPFFKFSTPVKILVKISNTIIFCATVAGSETVFFNIFGIHGGSIITTIVSIIFSFGSPKRMNIMNMIIVPTIVILVSIVFLKDVNFDASGKLSIYEPFAYTSMNVVSGGFLIATLGKDLTKKQRLSTSILSGVIFSTLLCFIYFSIKNINGEMPLILKADSLGLSLVGNVILYLAMITTLVGTMRTVSDGKLIPTFSLAIIGLLISIVGFSNIVNTAYPILGAIGGIVSAYLIVYCIFNSKFLRYYTRRYLSNDSLRLRR